MEEETEIPEVETHTVTISQVAQRLGISIWTVRRFIYQEGMLPDRQQRGVTMFFTQQAVDDFSEFYACKSRTIDSVALNLSVRHPVYTPAQWRSWLRSQIYYKKALPSPKDETFEKKLDALVTDYMKPAPKFVPGT